MINPDTVVLTKTILGSIEPENIVYAEVTPPGAMGNSGGIIIYGNEMGNARLNCYETNLRDDEETFLLAENLLFKYSDPNDSSGPKERSDLYFDFYYGGMGNNVFCKFK